MAESTTRTVSRGLESESMDERRRLSESAGAEAAAAASWDEASGARSAVGASGFMRGVAVDCVVDGSPAASAAAARAAAAFR